MAFVDCNLPHPIFIALTGRCLNKASQDYPGLALPQTAEEVEADFLAYSAQGVLTLVDEKQPDNPRVSFCTPRYELVCGLTQQKDAYFVIWLAPLSLRSHNQLARGAVRVRPQSWSIVADLPGLAQLSDSRTGLNEIMACWQKTRQSRPGPIHPETAPASAAQLAFLSNIDTLIDLACEVELEQAAQQKRIAVKEIEPISKNTCRIQLFAPVGLRVGETLQAGIHETRGEFEGVVSAATGSSLTLRFYQPPEMAELKRIAWLSPKISTKQYTIQHAAVRALRNRESLNPHLLALIVENRFESYSAPTITNGADRPNPAQRTMIERALLVPDLLLALGPPGTGKTNTIREIVTRQAALGRKVLVTSKNNKAVDNVLDGLKMVQTLRIGREEVVAPEVRSLLIDNLASAMQTRILEQVSPVSHTLKALNALWPQIQQNFVYLSTLTETWLTAQTRLENQLAELNGWQTACFIRVEHALDRQNIHTRQEIARQAELARQAENARRRLENFRRLNQIPVLGPLFIGAVAQWSERFQSITQHNQQISQEIRHSRQTTHRLWQAYQRFITSSPQASQFKQAVEQAESQLAIAQAEITQTLTQLEIQTESLPNAPTRPPIITPTTLSAFFLAWQNWRELQTRRQALLDEWREMLQNRPQVLYPTLIRSAEVIGATCIGVATDARFEDLDFDLVIADEAGQIQVMDLLVPLVRARRAILVGDHLQLPPLVEAEIAQKIRENEPENQELGEWLEKSLFERLIERPTTPASHKVMLNTQYRMPRQIADFISAQFYAGNYQTGHQTAHTDVFFSGSPLVFVDTMKETRHFEQRAEDGQGYYNPTEARLIRDIFLAYQARGIEAGVIVPYKKQAEIIRRELRHQTEWNEADLQNRVATVDSFQGKEQDVILFGFTRSNAAGRIGFLAELRRLNVSLTRARQQLILVGDSVSLAGTPDPQFATLIKSLLESVKKTPKGYFYANELPRHLQP